MRPRSQVAGERRGQVAVLRARQAAEGQQAALAFGQLLRREAVLQRLAPASSLERGLDLVAVPRREDRAARASRNCGSCVVPADAGAHVVRQALGLADALPQPRVAAAAQQVVRHRQRRVVGVGVRQRHSRRARRFAFCLSGAAHHDAAASWAPCGSRHARVRLAALPVAEGRLSARPSARGTSDVAGRAELGALPRRRSAGGRPSPASMLDALDVLHHLVEGADVAHVAARIGVAGAIALSTTRPARAARSMAAERLPLRARPARPAERSDGVAGRPPAPPPAGEVLAARAAGRRSTRAGPSAHATVRSSARPAGPAPAGGSAWPCPCRASLATNVGHVALVRPSVFSSPKCRVSTACTAPPREPFGSTATFRLPTSKRCGAAIDVGRRASKDSTAVAACLRLEAFISAATSTLRRHRCAHRALAGRQVGADVRLDHQVRSATRCTSSQLEGLARWSRCRKNRRQSPWATAFAERHAHLLGVREGLVPVVEPLAPWRA